jgi:hypothetical protein
LALDILQRYNERFGAGLARIFIFLIFPDVDPQLWAKRKHL